MSHVSQCVMEEKGVWWRSTVLLLRQQWEQTPGSGRSRRRDAQQGIVEALLTGDGKGGQ